MTPGFHTRCRPAIPNRSRGWTMSTARCPHPSSTGSIAAPRPWRKSPTYCWHTPRPMCRRSGMRPPIRALPRLTPTRRCRPEPGRPRCAAWVAALRPWMPFWRERRRTLSLPPGRPATMPKRPGPWASACSETLPSPPSTRSNGMGCRASPSWISMCTTATARRTFCGTSRARFSSRRTRCRSIPAPGPPMNGARMAT